LANKEGGMDQSERIARLQEFKEKLVAWEKSGDAKLREWLNQNMHSVRRETLEAGSLKLLTISPPPAVGGLIMRNVDPFSIMFDRPYLMRMVPTICDMLDMTIGALRDPLPEMPVREVKVETEIRRGYAFVAMPMDNDDHALIDVLEAIKAGAMECGVVAERIDDDESSERITDRILESIRKAEFVIVDLTNERPSVLYEAGFAHGIEKIPIYVARQGTKIHFDVKDYPVIIFRNMKELREGVARRLRAIAARTSSPSQ
jgi:hypothetical protein